MSQESLSTNSLTRLQRGLSEISDEDPVYYNQFKRSQSGTDIDMDDMQNNTAASYSDLEAFDTVDVLVAIKEHPCLYDPLDPNYRTNRKYRSKLWNDIRVKLNLDGNGEDLEKQWILLQRRYRTWRIEGYEEPNSIFKKMKVFDKYIVPLPERDPAFAALYKLKKLLADKETKNCSIVLEESAETLPEKSSADIFDVSSEEVELELSSMRVATPPPKKKTKAAPRRIYTTPSLPATGLRRSARHVNSNDSTRSSL